MRDNQAVINFMAARRKKTETLFNDLVQLAEKKNIEVRSEKILREVGYHARSGRCRLNGKDLIIVDRDEPLVEQISFLAQQLAAEKLDPAQVPEHLQKILNP
jgi:hypothetical protein